MAQPVGEEVLHVGQGVPKVLQTKVCDFEDPARVDEAVGSLQVAVKMESRFLR